jgi:O-antigen/teichoic acid export membrane protein
LLLLEHASQESYRFLVAQRRPIVANLLYFLRAGLWVYILTGSMFFVESARSLSAVWLAWACGSCLSLVLALFVLSRLPWHGLPPIDWVWIRRGLRVALPFLLGSVSMRAANALDKYLLALFWHPSEVGVFTFFHQLSNGIVILAESGILPVYLPRVLAPRKQRDVASEIRVLAVPLLALVLATVPPALLVIRPLLRWLSQPAYADKIHIYGILLLASSIQVFTLLPHAYLYACAADRAIVLSAFFHLLLSLLANLFLVPRFGATGAAVALLVASSCTASIKLALALHLRYRSA